MNCTIHKCNVYNSNIMKLRHSTICTLYSSTKFEALVRTKCIRRNMRSTCQWSCVLQFTWRRAVCCGLHRPMSQVIPCLGLKFSLFLFHNDINLCFKTQSSALSIGISKLPWRNPLETNNIWRVFIVACEYQGFLYNFLSSLHYKVKRSKEAYVNIH